MKSKKQDDGEHDKVLKSKYGIKDRMKSSAAIQKQQSKIMLTDLCPEEKLKVGELIKINQTRRLQIQQLSQQSSQLRTRLAESQAQLDQLQQLLAIRTIQSEQRYNENNKLVNINREKDQIILKITSQNKQYQEQYDKKNTIKFLDKALQTDIMTQISEGTQTKKLKTKQKLIQTNSLNEQKQQQIDKSTSRNHSKSFEGLAREKHKHNPRKNASQKESMNSHNNSCEDKGYIIQAQRLEDDVDECFEDLTEKWLQLKQKNLNKLRIQYEESRKKFYNECEVESHTDNRFITQENQEAVVESQQDGIDDLELNKLLKSKNFSASRLLTSKAMGESQYSRKKSYYVENVNTEHTKVDRQSRQLYPGSSYHLKTKSKQKENALNNDGDLMDLVDSLQ